MVAPEAGHFQGIGDAAARGFGQVLQVSINVIVGNEHGFALDQQALDARDQFGFFSRGRRRWRACPGVGSAAGSVLWMFVLDGFDG
ncbi:hypothetical protein D3C72_1549570 [compost metagenome]